MSEDLKKTFAVDEADPEKIEERKHDAPGSFLDVYRSLSTPHITNDERLVEASVIEGVVPESVRYGIMERGEMRVFRGVVKSTQGEMFYFNWDEGANFKLVPADTENKQWEAGKLIKSCQLGCDLIRAGSGNYPPHPDDEDEKELDKGADVPGTGNVPVDEEQWMKEQETMRHQVHPGAAGTQTPDDPTQGRNWHEQETIARAQDGMPALATNDGVKHWTAADLVKSWGQQLQQSAPQVQPQVTSLETEYMQTMLNISPEEIQKGVTLAPRHRYTFEQWRTTRLRGRLAKLQSWSKGNG